MNTALWIVAGLLAAIFLLVGTMKLTQPREKLAASGQGWVEDFPPGAAKVIGTLEVLGAVGLVLPALLDTATILVPIAASGIVLMMVGAAITHAKRGEYLNIVANVVLGGLAAFVAVERFGSYSF
jgi:uncharacterized membrane protein